LFLLFEIPIKNKLIQTKNKAFLPYQIKMIMII
jgi:hypothetical protein